MRMQRQVVRKKERKAAVLNLLVRLVVKDEKNRIIYDSGQIPSKSFVLNFLGFVGDFFDCVNTNRIDINNSSKPIYHNAITANRTFRADGGIGDTTKGIVVGSGVAPPTNTDYKLDTIMGHGIGAGQITYNEMTILGVAVVGANVDLVMYRSFTNNTGADRTVREVGVYVYRNIAVTGTENCYMIIRDVLGIAVTVPDKCSVTVYYTLRTTA